MIKLIIDVFIYQNEFYDTLNLFLNCYLLRSFVFLTNTLAHGSIPNISVH